MQPLKNIASDYENAEITCLFIYDRVKKIKINLLTIFELSPSEQSPSIVIGNAPHYLEREAIDKTGYTIYITRLVNYKIDEALNKYENIEKGLNLNYEKLDVDITFPYLLVQEPPNYHPILIDSNTGDTLGQILPKRHTSFRVWSKLNTNKDWLRNIDGDVYDRIIKGITKITNTHLGYDLSVTSEHLGNVYLCASNPILRKWGSSLLGKGKELAIFFYEREGKSIIGGKVVCEEKRSKNTGFIIESCISKNKVIIPLPYYPEMHSMKLYDAKDNLIETFTGTFIKRFELNMGIQESILNYRIKTKNGQEEYSIPKISKATTMKIGSTDDSAAQFLNNAYNERGFERLKKSKEFIFFKGDEESKTEAKKAIHELLNKAQNRCMILDPYFSAIDLEYVYRIQNISIPVQIISSASFLKDEAVKAKLQPISKLKKLWQCVTGNVEQIIKGKTRAEVLLDSIDEYKAQYALQKIQCKILRGDKSPLHDRYIVIDEDVYLLGSSLNEFGSRATTLFKIPTPKEMIEQALAWWVDNDNHPFIEYYVSKLKEIK